MAQLRALMIHCTATPEGRELWPVDIDKMHLGPCDNKDGTVTYWGKKYANRAALPNDIIGGVKIKLLQGRGWTVVGYAAMFPIAGGYKILRPYNSDDFIDAFELTNGATGFNAVARHIVYVGGVDAKMQPKDTRSIAQREDLKKYVLQFHQEHPEDYIMAHYHVAVKACPSFDVEKWLAEIGIPEANIFRKGKKL